MRRFNLCRILLVLAIPVLLSGCGSDEPAKLYDQISQAQEQKREAVVQKPKEEAESKVKQEAKVKAEKEAKENINSYLEQFRLVDVSWIKPVKDVDIKLNEGQNIAIISTTLYPDDEGKEFAEDILSKAVWGWANSTYSNGLYIDYGKVLDKNEDVLFSKKNHIPK